jgi:hypothetical protein
LLQAIVTLEGEMNEPKRTYRQAECCQESQSNECLHCRCCRKTKNWRQLHVGLIYTQIICHRHQKFLLTKQSTSDKYDVDASRAAFDISKLSRGSLTFKPALQTILIFNYVSFRCNLPITEIDVCFKKGLVGWKSQTQRPSIQEISK